MATVQTYDYVGKNVQEYYYAPEQDGPVGPVSPVSPVGPQPPVISTITPSTTFPPPQEATDVEPLPTSVTVMIFIFIVLWLVAGIAAFIMSIMCFGYSGSTMQHIIGFVLALFFGPFYWIYYFYVKSYCGVIRRPRRPTRPTRPMRGKRR